MSERFIRFTEDVDLVSENRCGNRWFVTSDDRVTPLSLLANCENPDLDEAMEQKIYMRCKTHNTIFSLMGDGCPHYQDVADIKAKAGDTATLPAEQAEWLVSNGLAEYPTHSPVISEGIDETITRTNAILDQMGLPNVDSESMRTIKVEGRRGSSHYARPRDKNLATDLGLDPDDIAQMKEWGSAKS